MSPSCCRAASRWSLVRESEVKPVGKPNTKNLHVRFDERGWETGRRFGVSARAHPRLYTSTRICALCHGTMLRTIGSAMAVSGAFNASYGSR
jgi:hypothetical protein